ncbi:MAG: hypothetical protein FJX92_03905 [Bacteroidetes bacterium]|nr:hypothetical protein [Bacteroidota bacterium]
MRKSIWALWLALTLTACKKNTTPEPDVAAEITITNPTAGTIFLNGSALQIRGSATDNNVLASVTCTIRNSNNNAILYNRTLSTGNVGFFDYSQNWTITGITTITPAKLIVTTTDKLGFSVSKEVSFQLID